MNLSLNETAAMAKKAARGAGYSWGMAEEAASAVRWLVGFQLDGCAALLNLLESVDSNPGAHRPSVSGPVWSANGKPVCPLAAGTAVADRSSMLGGLRTRIASVRAPLLLVPFAADAARVTGQAVELTVDGCAMVTDGECLSGEPFASDGDVDLRLGAPMGAPFERATRATPEADVWARLTAFAERTYAPATEASRLLGAGAGTNDND